MINLTYQNNNILVYKVEDWDALRNQHRIIGELLGSTQYVPVLPLRLLPEEAILLQKLNVAQVIKIGNFVSAGNIAMYEETKTRLLEEEINIYKKVKMKQIENYVKHIINGKRKKGDTRNDDDIINDEVQRAIDINEETMIWPICLETPNLQDKVSISNEELLTLTNHTNVLVYEDLWKKGYYITSGNKFGGDFLVYLGDPILYHAVYIVKCLKNKNESLHSTELIRLGRLGASVKKKTLIATVDEDNLINYITLNWMDMA